MKFPIGFLFLISFTVSSEAILNGEPWTDAPYMVRLQYLMIGIGGGQGGGSIISSHHILTSGFVLTTNWDIVYAFYGGVTRSNQLNETVVHRVVHPNYSGNPRLNDIGIATLAIDFEFSRLIQPIVLPPMNSFAPLLNEQGTALGFSGHPIAFSEHLQAAFLRVESEDRCTSRYPSHQPHQQFCGEDARLRTDICADDISGPFITLIHGQEVLVGISSIHFCLPFVGSQPALFTRVSAYRQWINQVTHV